MAAYIDRNGGTQQVDISAEEIFQGAKASSLTPVQYINTKFADADMQIGPAFSQIQASMGILGANSKNPFGVRQATMAQLLGSDYSAISNTATAASPFGTASRALTAISIIERVESEVAKDRTTDANTFYGMVGNTLALNSEHFEQPVVNYNTLNGPEQIKAQRVAQGANPPKMLSLSTSDRIRKIGAWNIGIEFTDQALKATSLDFVSMTLARYLAVERDERAYKYVSSLFAGDGDLCVGAVPAVTTTSLDSAATGGVVTHKSWVKFLAQNRKHRKITHVIGDMDAYLAVESRTGRPGSNNYDPTLSRIDPQAMATNVGFGNDVKWFIVDSAANGGPVPANTVYAVDASAAITLVTNPTAAYSAVETYAMKRSSAMRIDWAEEVFRTFGDTDLRPFSVLTIS